MVVALAAIVVLRIVYEKISKNSQPAQSSAAAAVSEPLPDFTLTDQTNQRFGSSDLKGKVWVADFIFTRCQGPCPLQSSRMAALQKDFMDEKNIRFVSFSVDPDYDKPAVLSKYAARYGADNSRWHFLTGPTNEIHQLVQDDFHLAMVREKNAAPGQQVTHSLSFVLVDEEGKIRGYFDGADENDMRKLRDEIKALM